MTNAQLILIMNLRRELGLRTLSRFETEQMTKTTASLMINDLQRIRQNQFKERVQA